MYSSGIGETTFCKIDLHLSDEESVSMQDTGQSNGLDLRDTHVCLICLSSFIGLDSYVDHKKNVCLLPKPRPFSKRALGCLMEIIGAFTCYSHHLERSLANIGNDFGNCGLNQYGETTFTASCDSSIQTEEKSDGVVEKPNQMKKHSGNAESNLFRDDIDAEEEENTQRLLIRSYNSVDKLVDDGTISTNHGDQDNVRDFGDSRSEENQMDLQSSRCSVAKSCIPVTEQCRRMCKVCKRHFRTVSNYEKHMTSQLHLKKCKSSDLSYKNVSIKRKVFPSRKIIENLEIENLKLEKLQCPKCRFVVFQSSFALAKHVLVEHKEEIRCRVFPKALLNRCCKVIAPHLPLSCLSCRFFTNRSEDLLSHLNAHSGVCSAPFKCTYCAFSTTDVQDVKTHLKCSSHLNMIVSKEKASKKYLKRQELLDYLGLFEKQPRKVSGDLLRTGVKPSRESYGQSDHAELQKNEVNLKKVDNPSGLEDDSSQENASFTLHKNENNSPGARKSKDRPYSFENILGFENKEDHSSGSKEDKDNQTYSLVIKNMYSLTEKNKDNKVEKHHPLSKKEYEGNCSQYGFQNSLYLKQQHTSSNLKEDVNICCISEANVNLREQGNPSSMKEDEPSRYGFKNLNQERDLSRVDENKDGRHLSQNALLSNTSRVEGSPLLLKGYEDSRHNYENTLDFPEEGITSCDKTDGGSLHSSENDSLNPTPKGTTLSSSKEDQYSLHSSENCKLDFPLRGIASCAKTREDRPHRSKISYDLEEDDNQSLKDDHVGHNYEKLSTSFQQKVTLRREKGNKDSDDCYEDSSLKNALPSYLNDEDSRHNYEKSSLNLVEDGSSSDMNDEDRRYSYEKSPLNFEEKGSLSNLDEDSQHSCEESSLTLAEKGSPLKLNEDSRHSCEKFSLNLAEKGNPLNFNDEDSRHGFEKSSLNLAEKNSSSGLNEEDSRHCYVTSSLNLAEEGCASNLNNKDSWNSYEKSSLNLAEEDSSLSLNDEESSHSYETSSLNSEQENYSSNWKSFKDSCHNAERSLSSVLEKEKDYPSGLKGGEKSLGSESSSSLEEEDGYCQYSSRASDKDSSSSEEAGKPYFDHTGDSFEQTDLQDNPSILKTGGFYGSEEDSSNTFEDAFLISFVDQENDEENEENVEILTDVSPRTEELNVKQKLAVVGGNLDNYCYSCDKMLSCKRTYENHKLSSLHLNKSRQAHKLPCSSKRKWVPSKKYLEGMHDTSTKSMCPKCYCRTFRSRYCLAKHVLLYHKSDIVNRFFHPDFLDQCWEVLTPRLPFSCTSCRFFAKKSDDLLTHVKSEVHPVETSGWLNCYCSFKTKDVELLQQHFLSDDHCKREVSMEAKRKKRRIETTNT